ncbi:hypothetical protein J2T57_001408 [Natronocella acetinitrilica]|uniref:Uncharacterized protein n=1 Tax=Natronocella acetinitrilica TaxID=414046 RepID=A0AAE3G3Y0_9GAMM|nr:hypothetical protein [Natronocella acetinitrilica]MCP1674306.1 hypothetical protein [Natronocella acetinitrilica]
MTTRCPPGLEAIDKLAATPIAELVLTVGLPKARERLWRNQFVLASPAVMLAALYSPGFALLLAGGAVILARVLCRQADRVARAMLVWLAERDFFAAHGALSEDEALLAPLSVQERHLVVGWLLGREQSGARPQDCAALGIGLLREILLRGDDQGDAGPVWFRRMRAEKAAEVR